MTTTTINPYPNIAPPAGAEAMCDWADWDNKFRHVWGDRRHVGGTNIVLTPFAAQLPTGSIDTDALVAGEPPQVMIDELRDGDIPTNA